MNRFLGKLSRRDSSPATSRDVTPEHADDSPAADLLREMKTFCESSSSPENSAGNEFVHLPRIVEIAESSPAAAQEAAYRIRKYLSTPQTTPNHIQYNAIMVMRILVDNPGHTFTRNFDTKFVSVMKDLLRTGRDWHVQHYLRQYLNTLEGIKREDPDLQPLLQMWAKEKTKGDRSFMDRFPHLSATSSTAPNAAGAAGYQSSRYMPPPPAPTASLPTPGELAARVEEARNSAKLLTQFVQTTPAAEMDGNELIKEFIDRCRSSSRLIQSYIHSTNPTPDEETLLTLIECNDEISVALSQQQRAMLKARKARGSVSPAANSNGNGNGNSNGSTRGSPPTLGENAASGNTAMTGGRITNVRDDTQAEYEYNAADFEVQNPFADDYATHEAGGAHNAQNSEQGGRVQPHSAEHA
ncbi:hypothetical protein N7478_001249 [Penicillium angulare]|uniref:uncharacterized protein n=1 Tax=Penicillium angulare TaxID=116970 RepID=UPI00253FB3C2|nr:uncharacterized protein N7478_001249 [Penicillium angulare]KAJ5291998.1 hypothetical protein N7478_001249 [Penicillium angulare]